MDQSSLIRPKPFNTPLPTDDSPFSTSTQATVSKAAKVYKHGSSPSKQNFFLQHNIKISPKEERHITGTDARVIGDIKKSVDTVLRGLDFSKLNNQHSAAKSNFSSRNSPSHIYTYQRSAYDSPYSTRGYYGSPRKLYINYDMETFGDHNTNYYEENGGQIQYTEEEEHGTSPSKIMLTNSDQEYLPTTQDTYRGSPRIQVKSPSIAGNRSPIYDVKSPYMGTSPSRRFNTEVDEGSPSYKPITPQSMDQLTVPGLRNNESNRFSVIICQEAEVPKSNSSGTRPQGKFKHFYVQPPPDKSPMQAKDSSFSEQADKVQNAYLEVPKQTAMNKAAWDIEVTSEEEMSQNVSLIPKEQLMSPKISLQIPETVKSRRIMEESAEKEESPSVKKREYTKPRKMTDMSATSEEMPVKPHYQRTVNPLQVDIPTDEEKHNLGEPSTGKFASPTSVDFEGKHLFRGIPVNKSSQFSGSARRQRWSFKSDGTAGTLPLEDEVLTLEVERLRKQVAEKDAQIRNLVGMFMGLERKIGQLIDIREKGRDVLEEATMTLREGLSQILNSEY